MGRGQDAREERCFRRWRVWVKEEQVWSCGRAGKESSTQK